MKKHIIEFVAAIVSFLFLTHFVVYSAIVSIFQVSSPGVVWFLRIIFIVLWLSFVISNLLSAKHNNVLTRLIYRISAVWLGFLFYFFFAAVIYGIVLGTALLLRPEANIEEFGAALFLIATLTVIYGMLNAKHIHVNPVRIKITNLPDSWKNKTVVFFSDTHLGQVSGKNFLRRIVSAVNLLKPDLVFIGGDLYDGVKVSEDDIITPLKDLVTTQGAYFVTGNHDGFSEKSRHEFVEAIKRTGLNVLENHVVNIDGMQVIGADYHSTATREHYSDFLKTLTLDKTKPSILIKHVPSYVDLAREAGIMLQLSGHTHRAQMQPVSFMPRLIYNGFDYGLKSSGPIQVFVSSGAGTWGPPLRVGTQSEIVLLTFE